MVKCLAASCTQFDMAEEHGGIYALHTGERRNQSPEIKVKQNI